MTSVKRYLLIGITLLLINSGVISQGSVKKYHVAIHGIADNYNKAIEDAKRQAIERAGITITSETKIENYQLKSDVINSKAEGFLLPGYDIVDIGSLDGSYHVVLVGDVTPNKNAKKSPEEYFNEIINNSNAYIKMKNQYYDKGKRKETKDFLYEIIKRWPGERAEKAFFLLFYWDLDRNNTNENFESFVRYYPKSNLIETSRECILLKLYKNITTTVSESSSDISLDDLFNDDIKNNSVKKDSKFDEFEGINELRIEYTPPVSIETRFLTLDSSMRLGHKQR